MHVARTSIQSSFAKLLFRLQSNFFHDPKGTESFESVYQAYKAYYKGGINAHPDVTREQLQDALEKVFFGGKSLPPKVNFTAKNYLKRVADIKGASDQRQDALLHPDSPVSDPIRRAHSPARDASQDSSYRAIPPKTRQRGCTTDASAEHGEEATEARTHEAGAGSSAGEAMARGEAGGSAERLGVSARQRVGDGNQGQEDDEVDLPTLARKWLEIKPGGAFARPQPQQRRRRNVDVLKWDV